MLGQLQPVGTGDRNTGVLQRLDHRVKGVAAPAHQDQHIAITQRPARAGMARHSAGLDQPLDLRLDAPCKLHVRACRRDTVERRAPAFDVLLLVGFRQTPELDQARSRIRQ